MENLLAPHRVLDLTSRSGAFCGKLLGDLGADVIKIEQPGGDGVRLGGRHYQDCADPEGSLDWLAFNTGKRSITLDIETAEGRDIFLTLARRADFVLESFAPGYMTGLGLGYPELKRVNPAIIMTSITPFGQSGPYKDYRATDLICTAMGGSLYIVGDEDRSPVQISSGQSYYHAGAQAAVGSLIAHHWRKKTGEGQHVDVSIQESIMWTLTYPLIYAYAGGTVFRRAGNYQQRAGGMRYRRIYPCRDGFVCCALGVGLMVGPMQARLVEAMDREGMAGNMAGTDWRSLSIDEVPQHKIDEWETAMAQYFMRHTKAELQALSLKHRLHVVPVRDIKEVSEYEQLRHRNYWARLDYPHLEAEVTCPGQYFTSGEVGGRVSRRAPEIGEHNMDIYQKELGFSPDRLHQLERNGVI
ncbi:MAG: CoA transferase [Dehalococcoidia bacterium]